MKLLDIISLSTKRKAGRVHEAVHSITAHPATHVPTEEPGAKCFISDPKTQEDRIILGLWGPKQDR